MNETTLNVFKEVAKRKGDVEVGGDAMLISKFNHSDLKPRAAYVSTWSRIDQTDVATFLYHKVSAAARKSEFAMKEMLLPLANGTYIFDEGSDSALELCFHLVRRLGAQAAFEKVMQAIGEPVRGPKPPDTHAVAALKRLMTYVRNDLGRNAPDWQPEDIPEYLEAQAAVDEVESQNATGSENPIERLVNAYDGAYFAMDVCFYEQSAQVWCRKERTRTDGKVDATVLLGAEQGEADQRLTFDPATRTVTLASRESHLAEVLSWTQVAYEPDEMDHFAAHIMHVGNIAEISPKDEVACLDAVRQQMGRIWWVANSEAEYEQSVENLRLSGARMISNDKEMGEGTINYCFEINRNYARAILGYQPDEQEWLDEDDPSDDVNESSHAAAPKP